jgi:hypothetical protein
VFSSRRARRARLKQGRNPAILRAKRMETGMGSRGKGMFGGLACSAVAFVAPVILGGCDLLPQMYSGTASAQFQVTNQTDKTSSTAENGAALQFPGSADVDVKVNAAQGAQRMNVLVTGTVPACGTAPVPADYATKKIVYPLSPEQAANTLVQDWPLSGWTLRLLNLCSDPSSPSYPAPYNPAGSFLIRAQVQDANGNWTESDLTIQIAAE